MDLANTLSETIRRLEGGQLKHVTQVKNVVIHPVLQSLGWYVTDPDMVGSRYSVGHGFVDFALLQGGVPQMLLKIKRTGDRSLDGEMPLFQEASQMKVPLLVITDGMYWDFYLTTSPGAPEERRFLRMKLSSQTDLSRKAECLKEFVQRDRVMSGQSRRSAEERLEGMRQRRKTREAIPQVWAQLVQDPGSLLIPMISEEVAEVCGSAPDVDDVKTFLSRLSPDSGAVEPDPRPRKMTLLLKQHRIVGFEYNGETFETGTAIQTLAKIVQLFDGLNSEFMPRLEERTTSPKRKLVARERSELFKNPQLVNKNSQKLGNGWWLGKDLSVPRIRQRIETACEVAGVTFGTELKLIEREK